MSTTEAAVKNGREPLTQGQANDLIRRGDAGDESARAPLADFFRDDPNGRKIATDSGAPQYHALFATLKAYAGGNVLMTEATRAALDALRRELYGEGPTPLERLLADRVVVCWFHLGAIEYRLANPPGEGRLITQADFIERQLNHATRRFLASVRSLAVVRKLAVPSVLAMARSVSVRVETAGGGPDEPPRALTGGSD